jgi:ABC-2 type transport system permease protein
VKKMFEVTKKDLLLLWKDKVAFIWMLGIPILLMATIGSVFNFSTNSANFNAPLPVVNQDAANSKQFTDILSNTGALSLEFVADESAANRRLSDPNNSAPAYIVIPAGFGAALQGTGSAKLKLVLSPGDTSRAAAVQGILKSVMDRYTIASIAGKVASDAVAKYAGPNAPSGAVYGEAAGEASQLSANPPVSLDVQTAQEAGSSASGFDVIVPGYALMFALFSINGGASSILEEKEAGTFKRLLLTPLRPWALIGGKMAAQYIMGVLQIGILIAVGIFIFGAHAGNVLGLILLVLAVPFAATGLGMLLVSLVKTRRQLQPISTAVILGSAAISGTWFPLWLEPQWLQGMSRITLNTWAIEGFNQLMIFGKGVVDILPNILVLIAYGLICYLLATRFFRLREGDTTTVG